MILGIFAGIDLRIFGGGERYAIELSKRLDLDVTIFSPNQYNELFRINDKQLSQMLGENTTLVVYSERLNILPYKFHLNKHISLSALRKMKNVDVIYSTDTGIVKFFQILFFSKLFGKKVIFGLHEPFILSDIVNKETHFLASKYLAPIWLSILKRYDGIHVLNSVDRDILQQLGIKTIFLIPNFIYFDTSAVLAKKFSQNSRKNSKFRILFVGRLDAIVQKGIDMLIAILNKLTEIGENIEVHIVGSGDDGHLFDNLDFPFVHKVGFLPDLLLQKEYLEADLFILTSRFESFPLVVVDAQAYGLAVVSFKIKGVSDILQSDWSGKCVERFSIDQFTLAIFEFYNLWVNDYGKYQENIKKIIHSAEERFGAQKIIPQIEQMINYVQKI